MATTEFQRARSAQAKQQRETAILDAAVGMHKSAMLRYFETREQIFLRLTALGWREWSAALRQRLGELPPAPAAPAAEVAAAFADSLVARPMFCDLLAQAPLNLERNVSLE